MARSFLEKARGFCCFASVNRYLFPPHPPYGREPLKGASIASDRISIRNSVTCYRQIGEKFRSNREHELNHLLRLLSGPPPESAASSRIANDSAVKPFSRDASVQVGPYTSSINDLQLQRYPLHDEIARYSPEEFFAWFDNNWKELPHTELAAPIQKWLTAQAGKSYGSFEVNNQMVKGLRRVLRNAGVLIACPGEEFTGYCGEPSRLTVKPNRNKKPTLPGETREGIFRFKHVGGHDTCGYFKKVPLVSIHSATSDNESSPPAVSVGGTLRTPLR